MLPNAQLAFAEQFGEEKFQRFLKKLDTNVDMHIKYRVCEMPIFVSEEFRQKLESAAVEIMMECVEPEYLRLSDATLEPRYTVPNQNDKPLFCIADFAVAVAPSGEIEPKLIELQGFPSLYGYQFVLGKLMQEFWDLERYGITMGNFSESEYIDLLRTAILGNHAPENVALLEIHPEKQKTRPDFLSLRKLIGIEETDICSVKKEGNKLFHQRAGKWTPIHRIFNRAIVDELDAEGIELPFSWTDELDVEWAGHPNWYFRISKFSLPFLKHESVPRSWFLDKLTNIPDDLSKFVLKPLYSFAGKGVNVSPTYEDISAVPESQRGHWVLQEKVTYSESIFTPEGMNKVELRVMMIWLPEWNEPKPVMSLARTGRGPMMGVRYNNIPWTGSSGCLFGKE